MPVSIWYCFRKTMSTHFSPNSACTEGFWRLVLGIRGWFLGCRLYAVARFFMCFTVLRDPHARFVEVKQQVATTLIDKTHMFWSTFLADSPQPHLATRSWKGCLTCSNMFPKWYQTCSKIVPKIVPPPLLLLSFQICPFKFNHQTLSFEICPP